MKPLHPFALGGNTGGRFSCVIKWLLVLRCYWRPTMLLFTPVNHPPSFQESAMFILQNVLLYDKITPIKERLGKQLLYQGFPLQLLKPYRLLRDA